MNTHGNSPVTPGLLRSPHARRVGVSVESIVRRESGGPVSRQGGAHRRNPVRGSAPAPLLAATAVAGATAASVSSVVVLATGGAPVDLVHGDVQAAGHSTTDRDPRVFAADTDDADGGDHELMDGRRIAALAQLAAGTPTVLASVTLPQVLPSAPAAPQPHIGLPPAPAAPLAPPAAVPNDPGTPATGHTDDWRERPSSGSDESGSDSDHGPRPTDPPSSDPNPSPSPDPDPTPSPDPDPTPSPDPDPTPSPDPDPTPSPDPDPTPSPDPSDPPAPDPGDDDPNPPDDGGSNDGGSNGGGSGGGGSNGGGSNGGGSDGGGSNGGGSDGGSSDGGGSNSGGSDGGGSDSGGSGSDGAGGSSGGDRGSSRG